MAITTSSFYQKNIDLFQSLDKEISDIQLQVSTGKKTLSLDNDSKDIYLLDASKEHRIETMRYKSNAETAVSDLTRIDTSFERLQNASVRLKELHIESSNGFLTSQERQLFKREIAAIKEEIFSIANGRDALGNGYFSGTSEQGEPFKIDNFGVITYSGSTVEKTLQVSRDGSIRQNFNGNEVFLNAGSSEVKFSVFDALDEFSRSLDYEMAESQSSNILSGGNFADLTMPPSGQTANYRFDLLVDEVTYQIDANAYSNDFSGLVSHINSFTALSGVTAATTAENKLRLSGTAIDVKIANFGTDQPISSEQSIQILKDDGQSEILLTNSITNFETQEKMHQVFEHFIAMRSELSIASRSAQNTVSSAQETLVNLNEEVASIEDADMAALLTQLQDLLNKKDAAQATFSRITSKSLFDFMG